MELQLEKHEELKHVREFINSCQLLEHTQQVAYSTYHDCLTQICFRCRRVRTNLKSIEKQRA